MEFSKEVDLQKLLSSKKDKIGPMIRFDPIDEKVGGLQRNLVILGGFSGCFKTTFALNIAYNNAVELGYGVAFSSLEMDPSDLWLRLVLRHAQNPKFLSIERTFLCRTVCGILPNSYLMIKWSIF